ncbi:MAG: histidinol-phosphate transaminase [Candidatus Gracilibacteria bacterium]
MNYSNPQIQKMKAYSPPLEGRRDFEGTLLDFNERTVPVNPKVVEAVRDFLSQNTLQVYPEYGTELTRKIADYAGVLPEQVMVTNGSDQGIELIFRTFTSKGEKVIIPTPSFAMFDQCAGVTGNEIMRPVYELPSLSFPVQEVLRAIDAGGVKLLVICNPNNPTGTLLDLETIEKILKKAEAKGTMVYVDEAYFEFSKVSAAPLIKKYPNLLITRTFSKAFGLPSLRIGYVLSQEANINELSKVRGPYDVNMPAFVAAKASLDNRKFVDEYVAEVMDKAKPLLEDFFTRNKIEFYPSGSNFILFKPKNSKVYEILAANGILTRPRSGPNIDGTVRVTIGTASQIKEFIRIFREKILQKYAFLDRDGALIFEPTDTFQIDSIEKLQILPGAKESMQKLIAKGYKLALVSNQNGVGTPSFPQKDFDAPQNMMLEIFERAGIVFDKIFICPHLPEDNCECRKPKLGLVKGLLATTDLDFENSFMCGDRKTDEQFAENIGIRFIPTTTNQPLTINI